MQGITGVLLDALQTDARRLEQVALNLTNQLTPGYRRSVLAVGPSRAGLPGGSFWPPPPGWKPAAKMRSAPTRAAGTRILGSRLHGRRAEGSGERRPPSSGGADCTLPR